MKETTLSNDDAPTTPSGEQVGSDALFAFVDELEQLKQEAEQRGGDLMLPLYQREANKAGASAYTFCQIRLQAIISQANAGRETREPETKD